MGAVGVPVKAGEAIGAKPTPTPAIAVVTNAVVASRRLLSPGRRGGRSRRPGEGRRGEDRAARRRDVVGDQRDSASAPVEGRRPLSRQPPRPRRRRTPWSRSVSNSSPAQPSEPTAPPVKVGETQERAANRSCRPPGARRCRSGC